MIPLISEEPAEQATGLTHRLLLDSDPSAPLVVLVHGRAGNAEVMWAFRRAFPDGCSFIAPQAFLVDVVGGWSWWDISQSSRENITRAISKLDQFIVRAQEHYQLKPRCLIGVGFSQGAGLLSALMQRSVERFRAVALLAGFVLKEPEPALKSRPDVFVAHGESDPVVSLEQCREGVAFLRDAGFPVELHLDQVGHKVGSIAGRALKVWANRVIA